MRREFMMKKKLFQKYGRILVVAGMTAVMLTACSQERAQNTRQTQETTSIDSSQEIESGNSISDNSTESLTGQDSNLEAVNHESGELETVGELTVRFGDNGEDFVMYLYDNDTAAAIARHVGTEEWRLPIYHYDDYDGWEYMQYYDIPSRYEIPSEPEKVTMAKAGEVYYSDPNRIILFYHDAEISESYTKVGYFEASETFISSVENNPVLEGWGNKTVYISDGR